MTNQLVATIVRGIDLKAAHRGGTSDPYVIVKHLRDEVKTPIKKKTINPEWNFMMAFPVSENQEERLDIQVFSWNRIGKHVSCS